MKMAHSQNSIPITVLDHNFSGMNACTANKIMLSKKAQFFFSFRNKFKLLYVCCFDCVEV